MGGSYEVTNAYVYAEQLEKERGERVDGDTKSLQAFIALHDLVDLSNDLNNRRNDAICEGIRTIDDDLNELRGRVGKLEARCRELLAVVTVLVLFMVLLAIILNGAV